VYVGIDQRDRLRRIGFPGFHDLGRNDTFNDVATAVRYDSRRQTIVPRANVEM
jgi:hypothetical protein